LYKKLGDDAKLILFLIMVPGDTFYYCKIGVIIKNKQGDTQCGLCKTYLFAYSYQNSESDNNMQEHKVKIKILLLRYHSAITVK